MTRNVQGPEQDMPAFHPSRMLLLLEPLIREDRTGRSGYRITSPHLPGWATLATTAAELARCVEVARDEGHVRAYANAHGEAYDLTSHADAGSAPRGDGEWHDLGGGLWMSPKGRKYPDTALVVQRVMARLARLVG